MKRVIFTLLFIAFLFQGCVQSKSTEVEAITMDEMNTHIKYASVPVSDIQNKEDFKKSHLVNATNVIENKEFRKNLDSLDKKLPIAVYFTSSNNSVKAANILKDLGFKQIYILDGGIKKFDAEIQPVK